MANILPIVQCAQSHISENALAASSDIHARKCCRYAAIMAPAILTLQRHLRDSGFSEPQTPHETCFRDKYIGQLLTAVADLQSPDLASTGGFEQAFESLRAVTRTIGDECRCMQLAYRCGKACLDYIHGLVSIAVIGCLSICRS